MTDAAIEPKPAPDNAPNPSAIPPDELARLTDGIVAALKTVYDPEIPVDIYELGLIYKVDIDDDRNVAIEMTLTAPGCPVAGEMPGWVEAAVERVEGVRSARANLVFDRDSDSSAFGPSLRWNLFDGGRLRQRVQALEASAEAAQITLEQTVLLALEEAENAMTLFVQ